MDKTKETTVHVEKRDASPLKSLIFGGNAHINRQLPAPAGKNDRNHKPNT
jgi:hypothetical protein